MDAQNLNVQRFAGGAKTRHPQTQANDQSARSKPVRPTLNQQQDELTFSPEAIQMGGTMSEAHDAKALERQARIARIQAEIAAGTYDTEERLEAAMMKFLSTVSLDD